MPTLAQKAAYWERELLDMSKRNRMLHFRETKRSSLEITKPDFFDLYQQIVKNEKSLSFQRPIGRDTDPRAYSLLRLMELAGAPVDVVRGDIHTSQRIRDQMLTLRSLRNKAQLAFDEQGTNLLYLVFGFIRWFDGDKKSGDMNSPFLLVPVSFAGSSAHDYVLKLYEDDISINPTLSYALQQKKQFVFPEFDPEKDSFASYIRALTPVLEKAGMSFVEKCCLGVLSFQKINMYLDLKKNSDKIKSNPVLQEIYMPRAGAERPSFDHDAELYENRLQVLSADSSQMDAISLSRQGKSFVLQGPPGTGKSQTIANIIAQALADRKKVLFVSEKMAALQVVYRRLEEVGLGDFCLPLHDYKADKKQILRLIAKPLTLKKKDPDPEAEAKLARLEMLKRKLNLYPKDMHRVLSAYQMSLYDAMSRLETLRGVPACRAGIPEAHGLDRLTVLNRQEQLSAFGRTVHAMTVSPLENPWRGYRNEGFLPGDRQNVQAMMEAYLQAANDARLLSAQAQEEFHLTVRPAPRDLQHTAALLSALLRLPCFPRTWLEMKPDTLQREAENEKKAQQAYRENKQAAEGFFAVCPSMEKAADWLNGYKRLQAELKPLGVQMDSLEKAKEACALAIEKLDQFTRTWETHAGALWGADQPVSAARGLYAFLESISHVPVFSAHWIRPGQMEEAIRVFRASRLSRQNHQQLQAALTAAGAGEAKEADAKKAYEAWKTPPFGEPAPFIRAVLQNGWQAHHPACFSSMPAFSSAVWMKKMNSLTKTLHHPDDFLFDQTEEYLAACDWAFQALDTLEKAGGPFIPLLPENTYYQLTRLFQHLPDMAGKLPVPFLWTKKEQRDAASQLLSQLSALQRKIKEEREGIMKDYLPAVFNLPAEDMLTRFETEYASFLGWLSPQKKKDLQRIQQCRNSSAVTVGDADALRVLRALRALKEMETVYQDLLKKNVYLLGAGQAGMPEDWSAIEEKLADFDAFCRRKENAYIEQMTFGMFSAVQDAVGAVRSAAFPRLNAVLTRWLPEAYDLPVPQARSRLAEVRDALREIAGLFRSAALYGNDGAANRQIYHAMKELYQEQNQLLSRVIGMLGRLAQEKEAFDALEGQRAALLAPAWREDSPDWDAFGAAFDVLAQKDMQNAALQISQMLPDMTLEAFRQLYESLKDSDPEQTMRLIRKAGCQISPRVSAKSQAAALRSALEQISRAAEFTAVAAVYAPNASAGQIAAHMQSLAEVCTLLQRQDARQDQCALWFGDAYAGWDTDWDRILQSIRQWRLCQAQFPEIRQDAGLYHFILASPGRDAYALWSRRAQAAALAWQDAGAGIEAAFEEGALDGLTQAEKEERLARAADHMEYLDQWLQYSLGREKITQEGLAEAVNAFEKQQVPPPLYGQAYEKAFLLAWVHQALSGSPDAARFSAQEKDANIEEFRELSQAYLSINRARLQDALTDLMPLREAGGEMSILKKELSKKTKLMPLRKLFRQIPYLLMKLKPCLMMSPLSVSYFLDSNFYHFDMIIFDEASQIFPQDAIGAILRGDQAIIAGDVKQMPPTDFFSVESDEEEEEENEEELSTPLGDSILEEADFTLTPQQLLWHYRSRDEQLIAFSNRHFYGDRLYTFPGSDSQAADMGVEYIFVPDGVYVKRHNDQEAEMCLRLIREHYEKHPGRSLGVVAFNEAQQAAIESLVWEEREKDPAFADALDANQLEPFFIKNLENVQGDERDTIIFSICFGRGPNGKFRYHFGPLGKAGGERRLNVAVTRAKCNVKLVGSIHAEDIDLARAKSEGARMLRYYIDYASHPDAHSDREAHARDAFADAVAQYLESQGWMVKRNVGRSAYTVDIAVYAKDAPGRCIAAVQCDGGNYASARTACDREVIRRGMLENLNWRIVNCWSADWFVRPDEARRELKEKLMNLTDEKSAGPDRRENTGVFPVREPSAEEAALPDIPSAAVTLPDYSFAAQTRYLSSDFPDGYSEYMRRILHCIRCEQPISAGLLYKRMAPLWGRQIASSFVRNQVNGRIEQMQDAVRLQDGYYVLADFRQAQPRMAGDREIDQIFPEELEADLAFVIRQAYGMERQEAIAAAARVMGYQRSGPKIIAFLSNALDRLQSKGKITIVQNKVQWKEEDA